MTIGLPATAKMNDADDFRQRPFERAVIAQVAECRHRGFADVETNGLRPACRSFATTALPISPADPVTSWRGYNTHRAFVSARCLIALRRAADVGENRKSQAEILPSSGHSPLSRLGREHQFVSRESRTNRGWELIRNRS